MRRIVLKEQDELLAEIGKEGNFHDRDYMLKRQDKPYLAKVAKFLKESNSQVFLGGNITKDWYEGQCKQYGDIDILAVFENKQGRLNLVQKLGNFPLSDYKYTKIDIGEKDYILVYENKMFNHKYLGGDVDANFRIVPIPKTIGYFVLPFPSQIDVSLVSKERF